VGFDAKPGAGGSYGAADRDSARALRWAPYDRRDRAGLLRSAPETLHGRLGPSLLECDAERDRFAVPCRTDDSGIGILVGPRPHPGRDLGAPTGVQRISRAGMDEGAMPVLRVP